MMYQLLTGGWGRDQERVVTANRVSERLCQLLRVGKAGLGCQHGFPPAHDKALQSWGMQGWLARWESCCRDPAMLALPLSLLRLSPLALLPLPLAGKFPFWDNVRDCTLQQVWKSILTDKINWNAPALREVGAHQSVVCVINDQCGVCHQSSMWCVSSIDCSSSELWVQQSLRRTALCLEPPCGVRSCLLRCCYLPAAGALLGPLPLRAQPHCLGAGWLQPHSLRGTHCASQCLALALPLTGVFCSPTLLCDRRCLPPHATCSKPCWSATPPSASGRQTRCATPGCRRVLLWGRAAGCACSAACFSLQTATWCCKSSAKI